MILFDGTLRAKEMEGMLRSRVSELAAQGENPPHIAAILFREDTGSQLYTRLKSEAAERVGIQYQVFAFSLSEPERTVTDAIERLNNDQAVSGIIVQKPWRKTWEKYAHTGEYGSWWNSIMSAVSPSKDVDGLHPATLSAVENGTWQTEGKVLPATCRAVLYALEEAKKTLQIAELGKTIIVGRSDLLGIPLYHVLRQQGVETELLGTKKLNARKESAQLLTDAHAVVSATGHKHLITGDLLSPDTILIDVGEPSPDINQASVQDKASFLTPVPGGIGPLTVSFLLENAIILASQ